MKVLFITNIPSPYRVAFFEEFGKLCDLTVLYEQKVAKDRDPKWKADVVANNYKEVYMQRLLQGKDNAFCPKVKKYLDNSKYEIIIVGVYSTLTGMYAINYMKRKKIPYFISCDGGIIKKDNLVKYRIKKYFLSGAEGYFSSAKVADEYLQYYGAEGNRIYRFSFTSLSTEDIINEPISEEEKRIKRKKLGITEDRVFLSVGQFIYRKGYDLLLKISAELPDNVGVYIVGGKPTDELLKLKNRLGLYNVHFVDFQEKKKLSEYYMMADVFVLPTREDIWGLVINEAMAHALPIITTDRCVAGMELVKENGMIIKSDSPSELLRAMQIYCQKTKEDLMIEETKSLAIIKNYTFEHMAKQYANVCKKI